MAKLRGTTTQARGLAGSETKAYSSRECEQQAIDAEIKSLEESVLALKRRRNALSPISSLPTEVITIIFSYSRLPSTSSISSLPTEVIDDLFQSCRLPGMAPPGRSPEHCLAWLRAAHVCHQWREIALNYPLFWSHVDFTNLTLAGGPEILARATKAPLHLEGSFPTSRNWDHTRFNAFEEEIQSRVSQIRYLSINAGCSRLQKIIGGLTSPAPTLEYLSLAQLPPIAASWRVSVHDTLFGGTTPRLTSLRLRNCDFSWKSPLLKGLRCLDAHIESGFEKPNVADWLDALREMPNLEKLILHTSSPTFLHSPFAFDFKRVVSLPSLTHLDIFDDTRSFARALSFLCLPALTKLRVTLEFRNTNLSNMEDVFQSLSQHANGPQDTEPLQSVLTYGERTCAKILAWPMPDFDVDSHDPFALLSVALSARVALSTRGKYTREQNLHLDSAMTALPLGIVTLTAQHRSCLDDHFWLRNAPKWPLLRCARLSLLEARGFIEMLLEATGDGGYPLLPSLTTLVLLNIPLSGRRTQRLCDALMKRVEQGVPLETLDLRTCRATTYTVQLLSEIVVDVWGPTEASETKEFVSWGSARRGPFFPECEDSSGQEDYSDNDSDDSHTSGYGEEWGDEGIDVEMEEDVEEGEDYYSDMGVD
ncbi:hypothetical protein EI94DRAFT_1786473 [Lactarius quietus]|nr:hypothetical protein EI94DRAFT_1786473 [Lactarius quietus]